MKHVIKSMGESMANAYSDIYQKDYLSKMNFSADIKILEKLSQIVIAEIDCVRSPMAKYAIRKAYDELIKIVGEM